MTGTMNCSVCAHLTNRNLCHQNYFLVQSESLKTCLSCGHQVNYDQVPGCGACNTGQLKICFALPPALFCMIFMLNISRAFSNYIISCMMQYYLRQSDLAAYLHWCHTECSI